MLQTESKLVVKDNSGAKLLKVIHCLGGSKRRYSRIGDLVVATVKESEPNKFVKKEERIVKALVVATCRRFKRKNNTWIWANQNCAVLVKKEKNEFLPVGTRIFIPLLTEIEEKGYKKVFALAPEVL